MTELEEYTMGFFRKAAMLKTVSTISKILLLVLAPILLILFHKISTNESLVYGTCLLATFVTWILSTRKYNFVNMQIQTNLWLADMVNNPGDFTSFLHKNDIK